jgi:hypothetical protein
MSDETKTPAPSRLERIATQIAAGYAAASWNHATSQFRDPRYMASDALKLAKELIILLDKEENNP